MSSFSAPLSTRLVIRRCIRTLLAEHVAHPFLNVREADLQARLCGLLRDALPELLHVRITGAVHQHNATFMTSRVHLEMKIGGMKRSDVIVLRGGCSPVLKCSHLGPTDALATLDPRDVEAAIEIKAAPSRLAGQRAEFFADVAKLRILQSQNPAVQAYFVLVDKSTSVPGAVGDNTRADDTWTTQLGPEAQGYTEESPSGQVVEVWDLVGEPNPSPRVRFWC